MSMKPIFIMSSERSGSNLLRTLFGNHSAVCAPRAPHLLDVFSDLWMYYDTSGGDGYLHLLEDMMRIANHSYYGWDLNASAEDLFKESEPESFLDCFQALYERCAHDRDSEYIVCKENNVFDYAWQLLDHFDEGSFIYLYRDPRDYARSWMKKPMGINHPLRAARTWSREQQTSIHLRDLYGLHAFPISYEKFIENPEESMEGVLQHIGLDVESACFSTQRSDDEIVSKNEYWKNLNKPIDSSNKNKYTSFFDTETVRRIETIAKDEMLYLGYELDTDADWSPQNQRRGFVERVSGVASRAWGYFSQEIVGTNGIADESDEEQKSETERMISSVISLRLEIESRRKREWYQREGLTLAD